jgi:hypothetical protein
MQSVVDAGIAPTLRAHGEVAVAVKGPVTIYKIVLFSEILQADPDVNNRGLF